MTTDFDHFLIPNESDGGGSSTSSADEFKSTFDSNYILLLNQKKDALTLYKFLINSVIVYFAKEEESNNSSENNEVMSRAVNFLSDEFLQTAQEIKENPITSIEQKCLECEVMLLTELFILRSKLRPLSQTNILKKLRYLFAHRGNKIHEFLDRTICDEFLIDIPLYLTQIYEELEFSLPKELKKYESLENQIHEEADDDEGDDDEANDDLLLPKEKSLNILKNSKNGIKEKLKIMIQELKPSQENEEIKKKQHQQNEKQKQKQQHELRRSPRKSRPPLSYSPLKSLPRPRAAKNETPTKNGEENNRKRKLFVAETPEEKLAKKQCVENSKNNGLNEVVAQTPFDKIKRKGGLKKKSAEELKRILSDSTIKRRASKRLNFSQINNGCSQASSSSNSQNIIIESSQQASQQPKSQQQQQLRRFSNSLATLSRVSSTKSLSSISAASAPSLRSPFKKQAAADLSSSSLNVSAIAGGSPGSPVPEHLNAALTLTSDIIQKYKRRMDIVRLTSKKSTNSNEIFYGRLAGRANLFNELNEQQQQQKAENNPIPPPSSTTKTKTTDLNSGVAASQKNRSGRKVEQDTNAVYVAHTLLNAHNQTPLNPFKAPKDSPFKVRKLVKHATRGDWKKLQKFIAKNNHIDRIDSSSSTS